MRLIVVALALLQVAGHAQMEGSEELVTVWRRPSLESFEHAFNLKSDGPHPVEIHTVILQDPSNAKIRRRAIRAKHAFFSGLIYVWTDSLYIGNVRRDAERVCKV